MKTKLLRALVICVGLALLLTACGRFNRNISDSLPPQTPRNVSLRWGYGYGNSIGSHGIDISPDAEIVQHINSVFSVTITPESTRHGYDKDNPPHIFASTASPQSLFSYGVTRTIPIDMLAHYAPNYFNLLASTMHGLDVTWCRETDALLGLPIYTGANNRLTTFSVYRLDVLERHNIPIPYDIVPIEEGRIYFSETSFTFDLFKEIAQLAYAHNIYAPAIVDVYDQLQHLSVLKGMFGLGSYIVNDNGRVNYYFADPRYKEFLHFMADLYARDAFRLASRGYFQPGQHEYARIGLRQFAPVHFRTPVVWFQSSIDQLLYRNHNLHQLIFRSLGARYLITPPEVGPFGHSGAGINSVSEFGHSYTWVIGSHVSDDELAAILEIFDYVTFDRYAYVLTNFGFEGKHFVWEGQPFESRIIPDGVATDVAHYHYGTQVFGTGVRLPERDIFLYGDNALIRFAESEAGRRFVIQPYREDMRGDFALYYSMLTERYGETLMRIREEFLFSVIRGEIDVDAEWHVYIDELHRNGLSQFLTLIAQFPVAGR